MKNHRIDVPDDKYYFKSDGNGGFLISKSMLSVVIMVIVLCGYIVNSVMTYSAMQYHIEDNTNAIMYFEDYIKDVEIEHPKRMLELTSQINANDKEIEVLKTQIDYITQGIDDIKETLTHQSISTGTRTQ